MKTYQAGGMIQASPEVIWDILTDAEAYAEFDPSCERLEGRIQPGSLLRAYTKLAPGRAFDFKVTGFSPLHKMIWTGGIPLGLFKGERTFVLKPSENGQTAVLIQEIFSGPLLRFFSGSIPDLSEPFRQFITGLKTRAEAQQTVKTSEV